MEYEIVKNIIIKYEKESKGPVQGSQEWLDLRIPNKDRIRGRLGGSEIATLLGLNPYSNKKELLLVKLGKKKKIINNIMVHFGSLMEEVSVMVLEKMYKTEVFCKNISLLSPNNLEFFIFSPDGIALLPIHKNRIQLSETKSNSKYVPVLIEIKNPWSRNITENGVPEQYIPQIQAGLMSIPIANAGLFIDTQTKLCSYEQLLNSGYNETLHNTKNSLKITKEPINIGIILVKGIIPKSYNRKKSNYISFNNKKIIDMGNDSYYNTLCILESFKYHKVVPEYIPLYDNASDAENDYDKINNLVQNKDVIGIICYKVYDISFTIVQRDKEMIKNIYDEINKYSKGEFDTDEDYVPRKRTKHCNVDKKIPNIEFKYSSEDKESFNYDTDSS